MKLIALVAVALLAGCSADSTEETPAAPALDASRLADRGLATGSLPEIQLLATPGGRDLMARVVSCALPRGAAITAITRDGTPYSFVGALGLAPGWANHAPSSAERRRVDDCVRGGALGSLGTPARPAWTADAGQADRHG
jgi:hypothetical protein